MRQLATTLLLATLTGCTSPSTYLSHDAADVRVYFSEEVALDSCKWLATVTGSEGHWYNYLFYGNDTMIEGAMNALRNETHRLGGNAVLLAPNIAFATSVTYLGAAYRCDF